MLAQATFDAQAALQTAATVVAIPQHVALRQIARYIVPVLTLCSQAIRELLMLRELLTCTSVQFAAMSASSAPAKAGRPAATLRTTAFTETVFEVYHFHEIPRCHEAAGNVEEAVKAFSSAAEASDPAAASSVVRLLARGSPVAATAFAADVVPALERGLATGFSGAWLAALHLQLALLHQQLGAFLQLQNN